MQQEFLSFAQHLAEISGNVIRKYFRTHINIESKEDASPVTIADKTAEELMREAIMKEFPRHGILGEEFGKHNETAEYQWVIDPIDGTKSFICGAVSFGTLIALTKNGTPVLGVINQPILNEFLAGDNNTAELNGQKVKVRECGSIKDAVLLTTDYLDIAKYKDIDKFNSLARSVRLFRNWGDCYGYYLIATGFADIMIDPVMSVWDSMALIPVIRGAGGVITDYEGNDPVQGNSIVATGKAIHNKIIALLNN